MPPCFDQQVGGGAERRIGGDAGIAVRAAALQRERDFGRRPRLALGARRDRQHRLDALDAFGDRLLGAAGRLDGHGLEVIALDQAVFVLHAVDLEHLAAEARPSARRRDWDAWRSPIACGAARRSLRRKPPCRSRCRARTARRRRSPDSRPAGPERLTCLGDEFRDRRRAIHRGEDADIVARAGLAVRAHIALEGRAQLERQHLVVLRAFGEAIVAREIVHRRHCARAPSRPARSASTAKPMIWPNFRTGSSLRDRHHRHLVAARNALARASSRRRATPCAIWSTATTHVVVRRQADGARIGHRSLKRKISGRQPQRDPGDQA